MRTILRLLLLILLLTAAACGGDQPTPTATTEPGGQVVQPTPDSSAGGAPTPESGRATLPPVDDSAAPVGGTAAAEQAAADATATALSLPPTSTPNAEVEGTVEVNSSALLAETPVTTPDPDAGIPFDEILFEQTGGPADETLTVQIFPDGRVVANGVEAQADSEAILELDRTLNDIGFYNLPNTYAAIPGRADSFYYGITVTRAGAARRINAIDTTLTPELRLLIQRILALVPADASATSP